MEIRAGLNAGILAAAQTLTHGMIAFAPLGAAGVAFGMAAALAASAAAGICVLVWGSSRPLVGTTTAATALVTASLLAASAPASLAEAVGLAVLLAGGAGLLMLGLALAGFARLAALMPTPVTVGLGNAVVVLILLGQAPLLLGAGPGQGFLAGAPHPASLAVGAVAVLLMRRPVPGLPAPLVALAAASGLHHGLALVGVAAGPLVALAPTPAVLAEQISATTWPAALPWGPLLAAILSLALLATIEALAAGAALREASGRRAEPARDLRGSAAGMLAGAALGGMPATSLTVPSMACWRWGGRGRPAMATRAAVPLAALLLAGPAIAALPFAALAGVLVGAVWPLFRPRALWPFGGPRRAADALVVLAVVVAAVAVGLVAAVGIGVLLSVVIFTASMAQSPVRRSTRNPAGRSRVRRPGLQERLLRTRGETIALIELEGPIFFGSAERVVLHAEAESQAGATVLILDLSRVTRIDLSGARRLLEVFRLAPGAVLLAPMHPGSRAQAELEALGLLAELPAGSAWPDLPSAVEAAEERVLAAANPDTPAPPADALAALDALGLPRAAAMALLPLLVEQHHAAGSTILRRGAPADAAFLLLEGEVLISLPGPEGHPATRLAVLATGVVFGESALLGAMARTADAVARTEVRCLRLDARAAEALRLAAPEVAWQLMAAVARQLSGHVATANAIIDRLDG